MSDEKKWLDFEIASARHVMDLRIESSFRKTVNFQVHEMQDNLYRIFWTKGKFPGDVMRIIVEYIENNGIDKKTPLVEIFQDKDFAKFVQSRFTIHSADLSATDMKLVNAVIDANWEPVEYRGGLDGHSYKIKIYGENPREYCSWCDIPASWADLIPLVDFLIDVANLEPRDCYEVSMIDGKYLKPLPKVAPLMLELPPWMTPINDNEREGD